MARLWPGYPPRFAPASPGYLPRRPTVRTPGDATLWKRRPTPHEGEPHDRRQPRLAADRGQVAGDRTAERELNREVGEATRDWYELAHALADIVNEELAVQISEAHWYQIKTKYGVDDDVVRWLQDKCA